MHKGFHIAQKRMLRHNNQACATRLIEDGTTMQENVSWKVVLHEVPHNTKEKVQEGWTRGELGTP